MSHSNESKKMLAAFDAKLTKHLTMVRGAIAEAKQKLGVEAAKPERQCDAAFMAVYAQAIETLDTVLATEEAVAAKARCDALQELAAGDLLRESILDGSYTKVQA